MAGEIDTRPRKLIRYSVGPKCPRCGWDQFDDWWHVLKDRRGLQPGGQLECGGCEKVFFIEGTPGNLFSSCFGIDNTDRMIREVTKPKRRSSN